MALKLSATCCCSVQLCRADHHVRHLKQSYDKAIRKSRPRCNDHGGCFLVCAVICRHEECAEFLVQMASDDYIALAIMEYLKVAKKKEFDINSLKWLVNEAIQRDINLSLIFALGAIQSRSPDHIDRFIECSWPHIDINYVDPDTGRNALFGQQCKRSDNDDNCCCIQCTTYYSSTKTKIQQNFERILTHGVNVNQCDTKGHTSIDQFIYFMRPEFVKTIVSFGFDINKHAAHILSCHYDSIDSYLCVLDLIGSETFAALDLHKIVGSTYFRELNHCRLIVLKFVDRKANLNAQDPNGNTMLHVCAIKGHFNFLKSLVLFGGADADIPNHKGQKVIDLVTHRSPYYYETKYVLMHAPSAAMRFE